ncbi:MAG TPA: hypothetical protein ENN66_01795 [Proteobacteria bacterium]|nr:hypothetical protein [Pseudomonadota bacterium]
MKFLQSWILIPFILFSLCSLPVPAKAGELLKVDALVVRAADLKTAENQARRLAVDRALNLMGNREIATEIKEQAHAEAEKLVTINRVLNQNKQQDGFVQPVFFCTVDKTGLQALINRKRETTLLAMDRPQINIGITFRTIPPLLQENRQAFIDRINNHLEEYFSQGGFRIAPAPAAMLRRLENGDSSNAILTSFVSQSSEVNYLLYGTLDINPEDLQELDQGRYYKTRVGLTLRFYNILSHDVISFSRDVYGNGENRKASVINAMRNGAKVISEKVAVGEVVADWRRKLNEGFEYSLQFCAFHDRGWSKNLRRALKEHGNFISKSRGQNLTQIYRFKADPGKFMHPSIDFEDFLDDLVEADEVRFGLIVQNDRLYFVFGDDDQCFDLGFAEAEDALK